MNEKWNILIYEGGDGAFKLEVQLENETVWLTQEQMAILFDKSVKTINEHILNIYHEWELFQEETMQKIRLSGNSGFSTKPTNYYNLDVIISVGYRAKSLQWTHFRKRATARLKEYIIKWFAMDDERLKGNAGGNYWKELLDRIRDIRSSEKVIYRQVLDLYATSIDYDPKSPESINFFKMVQNKLHYATNQKTAAETIYERADAEGEFMGLTNFAGEIPVKSEITIAKNYLTEEEIFRLNRLVSAFFDLAEIKAQDHMPMKMIDWVHELDKFAEIYGKWVLENAGTKSHKQAVKKAESEYRKYQEKTLSPVEKEYLEVVKTLNKKIAKKISSKK